MPDILKKVVSKVVGSGFLEVPGWQNLVGIDVDLVQRQHQTLKGFEFFHDEILRSNCARPSIDLSQRQQQPWPDSSGEFWNQAPVAPQSCDSR